jgi:hypothetical protein
VTKKFHTFIQVAKATGWDKPIHCGGPDDGDVHGGIAKRLSDIVHDLTHGGTDAVIIKLTSKLMSPAEIEKHLRNQEY